MFTIITIKTHVEIPLKISRVTSYRLRFFIGWIKALSVAWRKYSASTSSDHQKALKNPIPKCVPNILFSSTAKRQLNVCSSTTCYFFYQSTFSSFLLNEEREGKFFRSRSRSTNSLSRLNIFALSAKLCATRKHMWMSFKHHEHEMQIESDLLFAGLIKNGNSILHG